MDSRTTLLCLVGMVGLTFGLPTPCGTDPECTIESTYQPRPKYVQVTDLKDKSIAPWTITTAPSIGDQNDWVAQCAPTCTMSGLIPKPIYVKLYYTTEIRNTSSYCRCPFKVPVGCTCIRPE